MTAARWVGVGESADANPFRAGAQARAAAVDGRADLRALIVFASASLDLEALLDGIAPGDVPLIGCSTAGEIGSSGPADRSVVVMALGGEGFAVSSAVATGLSGRLREAGAEVAACIDDIPEREHRTLLLLTDGLAGNQRDIVRGAYDVAGSVIPLVGGGAGNDLSRAETYQLYGGEVLDTLKIPKPFIDELDTPGGRGRARARDPRSRPQLRAARDRRGHRDRAPARTTA